MEKDLKQNGSVGKIEVKRKDINVLVKQLGIGTYMAKELLKKYKGDLKLTLQNIVFPSQTS